jgi:nucleoid DNA-binding protein
VRGREHLARSLMGLGLGRRRSIDAVTAFVDGVSEALNEGRAVSIVGFGSWHWKTLSPRKAHDPRTMRALQLPERRKLVFKPAETLKRRIQEGGQEGHGNQR